MFPKKFGRYEIKAELGRGGMATVYRAYDPIFDREVAIKVLPREFLHDPKFRDRFQREIKTVARLEHPAIVPVYDVGEEDDLPFFVMRYMSGGSLTDWIKRGRFSLEHTARIIEKLAQALSYAHRRGIIHRDLKPDNILFDDNGEPFISDFGVAKFTEAATNLTGTGLIGTPAYMSPEQAKGEPVDHRADIYGLGVIVYQMLSGRQPYDADTPMGVVVKHVTQPVPEILRVTPDLPESTDTVIKTAMAKDKQKRYTTATDLSRALNVAAFGTEGIIVNPPSTPFVKSTPPSSSSNRAGPIFGIVVVLVLLVGGFFLRNQFFVPATTTPTVVPTFTPFTPTLEASPTALEPTAIPTSIPPATLVILAPACPVEMIPTASVPTIRETNKSCIEKKPYTTLSIPEDAKFESLRDGFTCIKESVTGGSMLISCTGLALYSFDIKVCNPQTVPTPVSQSDADKCAQGTKFDSANQCCVPQPVEDASCTIFQVDLRSCPG